MKLKLHLISILVLAFLASCSTSNEVTNGRLIQKRKYNDGFYFSGGNNCDRQAALERAEKNDAMTALQEDAIALSNEITTKPVTTSLDAPVLEENEFVFEIPVESSPVEYVATTESFETNSGIAEPANVTIETPGTERTFVHTKVGRFVEKRSISKVVESASAHGAESTLMLILLVILCFIIPPVAVAIVDGISTRFWIDLIFFILGWGVGGYFFHSGLAYLCTLVAIIYALLIVLGAI